MTKPGTIYATSSADNVPFDFYFEIPRNRIDEFRGSSQMHVWSGGNIIVQSFGMDNPSEKQRKQIIAALSLSIEHCGKLLWQLKKTWEEANDN